MANGSRIKKITRIRTFKDDMDFARSLGNASTEQEALPTKESAPTVVLQISKLQEHSKIVAPIVPQDMQSVANTTVKIQNSTALAEALTPVPSMLRTTQPAEVTVQTKTNPMMPTRSLDADIEKIVLPQKESILSDENNEYGNENSLGRGSIIRDTKESRFKLLPSIFTAIVSTFTNAIAVFTYKKPAPTVAKAESRIGIIEKAARNSEFAPQEDFTQIAAHLKNVERTETDTALHFTDKSDVPLPSWSYITDAEDSKMSEAQESALALLNEDVAHAATTPPSVPQFTEVADTKPTESLPLLEHADSQDNFATRTSEIKREHVIDDALSALFDPNIHKKTLEEELDLTEDEIDDSEFKPIPELKKEETKATELPQEVLQAEPEIVFPQIDSFLPHTHPASVEAEIEAKAEVTEPVLVPEPQAETPKVTVSQRRYAQPKAEVSPFPTYLLVGVIFIASVLGVSVTYYYNQLQQKTTAAKVYPIASFITSQETIAFRLPSNKQELFSTLQKTAQEKNSVVHMYPTVPLTEGGERPATAEEILSVLSFTMPSGLTRSIKDITFGSTNTQAPFIIIKATSFDMLFAGMLAWENVISSELAPLFGGTVSFTNFKDQVASNKNIRILTDTTGVDRIVYTFLDQNTLLLTTNKTALETLLPLVK